jgi:hypothetical protein
VELTGKIVNENDVDKLAANLPPFKRLGTDIVKSNIEGPSFALVAENLFIERPYQPKFKLDYLGNTGVGLSTGSGFGTGLAGGVNGIFSDILGNNQLFGAVSLNGEIYDLGGQFAYLNQKKKINWGVSASHIPYLSGAQRLFLDTLQFEDTTLEVVNSSIDLLRTFEDQFSFFASHPFSQTRRLEGGTSFARYYYRLDRYSDYYDPVTGFYIGNDKEKLNTPGGFNLAQVYVAFVGDNSNFGVASPLSGHRFRFEAGQYAGIVNLKNITGDYRRYFRAAPFTLATRNLYIGRFGKDAENGTLPPLYIGYPTLVRGYDALGFREENDARGNALTIDDLIGSQLYVANAEIRYPFTGPERLSGIKSRFFLSELNLFTDAGVAWGGYDGFVGSDKTARVNRTSKFILSSGVSLRVNLFGYLIIEPFYAVPWQNGGFKNANFGLNFTPGW